MTCGVATPSCVPLPPRAMTAYIPPSPALHQSFVPSFRAPPRPRLPSCRHTITLSLDGTPQTPSHPSQSEQPLSLENNHPPPTDPQFVSIVEQCTAPPWKFNGQRVYMVHIPASECDVLEDPLPFSAVLRSPHTILFPEGWPDTVAPGYTNWVTWHVSRHIFRNAYYVLGTTSLLYSLGLGTGQALALGATLKWVLKDGLAMATKLMVSTNLASIVDADPKRWRFIGDSLMALSACVEVLSVVKPLYFLAFGTIAALLREAGGAMSGPAYRVFLDSFAISSNIGDVSSRGEAQVVIGNLLGLCLGVAIKTFLDSQVTTDRLLPTLACFGVLAACHLGSTFNAVSTVRLRTLNWQRLNLIIDEYLSNGNVPSVETVNRAETFVYAFSSPPSKQRLRVGAPLLDFVECGRDVTAALKNLDDRFVVAYNKNSVGIMLREDARPKDIVQAVLQGRRLLKVIDKRGGVEGWSRVNIAKVTAESYSWTRDVIPGFLEGLASQGWSMTKMLVDTEECRYRQSRTCSR